jgi:hypothetical protein
MTKTFVSLTVAGALSLLLGGCATTGVGNPTPNNRLAQIVRQFDAEVATTTGRPWETINNSFEAVRSICQAGTTDACRNSCAALPTVRSRVRAWNGRHWRSFPLVDEVNHIELIWEPDVDSICRNVY